MKKLGLYLALIIISITATYAQSGTLKGTVIDKDTKELLANANVYLEGTSYSSTSDQNGNFSIKRITPGSYELIISFVGYETFREELEIKPKEILEVTAELSYTPVYLGQITVTSMKKEKLERDVSMPLEVVTKTSLERIPGNGISDVIKNEPGVNLASDGAWSTHVNIRGLSRQNVVTLVDGNRIETATNVAAGMSLIDLEDIERIEVIKGGVSSLYGTGATGGVVNIKTSVPVYSDVLKLNGSVSSSYNSVNEGAKGNISISASQSNWYAKFNGTMRNALDTETPEGTLENSQFRDNNISGAVGFKPVDNHEIILNYQRFSAEDVGIPGGDPFPATAKATYPTELREMYSAEYKVQNLIPSLMTLSAKYFHQLIERRVELIPNPMAEVNTGADHTMDGFQVETDWYINNKNRLIAGIDYWQREYDGSRTRYVKPQDRIIVDSPVPNSTYKSLGIFAQDELSLMNDRLNLTLGGRYDFINVSNEETNNPNYIIVGGNRNDNPPVIPEASYPASEDDDKSWSANLGLLFNATQNLDFTFNIARAFRSPTLEERYQYIDLGGEIYLGNPKLEPEKSYSFDLGTRYWSKAVSIKADLFLNLFDDLVTDQYDFTDSLYKKQNIGEARLYGFDLSGEVNLYKDIVVYATASYVRGEDTGNDTDLPEIPPLNGGVGIKSSFIDMVNMDLNMRYASDQDKVAGGEQTTAGYSVFNLYLNSNPLKLGFMNLQVFCGVENIFDRAYRNHLSTFRGLINLEPGRNIFAKVKLSW